MTDDLHKKSHGTLVEWLMESSDTSLSSKEQALKIRRKLMTMNMVLHRGKPGETEAEIDITDIVSKARYQNRRTPERDEIITEITSSPNPFSDQNLFELEEKHTNGEAGEDVFAIQPSGRVALTVESLRECLLSIASGNSSNPNGTGQQHNQTEDLSQGQVG